MSGTTSPTQTVSVVVPTYRRPADLERCLAALARQEHPPKETLVVHRSDDEQTIGVLSQVAGVRAVPVDRPGLVHAMSAGAFAASGDILAFTDDDAAPAPDWVARLLDHFRDPEVGGVGGRDILPGPALPPATVVGRVTRWGRVIGNHHRGEGAARDVDVLKGVNMAYRREALALPTGLRGSGSQAHSELAIGLWVAGRGWRVVYDPQIVVDHRPAVRTGGDDRGSASVADGAYNLVYGLLSRRPDLLWRRAAYGLLVGDRGCPGAARGLAAILTTDLQLARMTPPAIRAQLAALLRIVAGRRMVMRPVAVSAVGDRN